MGALYQRCIQRNNIHHQGHPLSGWQLTLCLKGKASARIVIFNQVQIDPELFRRCLAGLRRCILGWWTAALPGVLNEATNRIRMDLNEAREIYRSRSKVINLTLNLTSTGQIFRSAIKDWDAQTILLRLNDAAGKSELDFMGMVSSYGRILCRIGPNLKPAANELLNTIAELALKKRVAFSGTVLLSREAIFHENPKLAEQARIRLFSAKRDSPQKVKEVSSGMVLAAPFRYLKPAIFWEFYTAEYC
jgi:hypothetical protein